MLRPLSLNRGLGMSKWMHFFPNGQVDASFSNGWLLCNFHLTILSPCFLVVGPRTLNRCGTLAGRRHQLHQIRLSSLRANFVVIPITNSPKLRRSHISTHFNSIMRCWINNYTTNPWVISTTFNSWFLINKLTNHPRSLRHQSIKHHQHLRRVNRNHLHLRWRHQVHHLYSTSLQPWRDDQSDDNNLQRRSGCCRGDGQCTTILPTHTTSHHNSTTTATFRLPPVTSMTPLTLHVAPPLLIVPNNPSRTTNFLCRLQGAPDIAHVLLVLAEDNHVILTSQGTWQFRHTQISLPWSSEFQLRLRSWRSSPLSLHGHFSRPAELHPPKEYRQERSPTYEGHSHNQSHQQEPSTWPEWDM